MEFLIGSKLENTLNGKVNIGIPNTHTPVKLGSLVRYTNGVVDYVGEPVNQFVLACCDDKNRKWMVGEGPAIPFYENDYVMTFENAFAKFVDAIVNYANKRNIRFNLMVLPNRSVEKCILEIRGSIVVRYVEDYLPDTDVIAKRYDVLLMREIEHAS